MYSDEGIFPRSYLLGSQGPERWSILYLNGSPTFVNLFFLLGLLIAVAFTFGWHTRIATVALWAVIVSIQFRNPHLQNGADTLLRVTMFWAMFLPLGRCWSVDSRLNPDAPRQTNASRVVLSVATFALIFQNAIMYFITATMKSGPRWHEDGSALYYALGARQITTGVGEFVFQHTPTWILTILTFGTLILEFTVPFMLLLPLRSGWLRTAAVLLVCGLHLGILTTMTVGFFPVVSMAIGIAVLPNWFWENVVPRVHASVAPVLKRLRIPERVEPFGKLLPSFAIAEAKSEKPRNLRTSSVRAQDAQALHFVYRPSFQPRLITRVASNAICSIALIMVLLWNIQGVSAYKVPEPVRNAVVTTGLYQSWSMFAPGPPTISSWIIVVGQLDSGEKVDLLIPIIEDDMSIRQEPNLDQRDELDTQDKYWRKFFQSAKRNDNNMKQFAGFVCRSWNAENSGDLHLKRLQVYEAKSRTLENNERAKPVFDQLGSWSCR